MYELIVIFTFAGIILYGSFLYPFLLLFIRRLFLSEDLQRCILGPSSTNFTLVICVKDEYERIKARLDNIFACVAIDKCKKIIVVSDGSRDTTESVINRYPSGLIELISLPVNSGKPTALNNALSNTTTDVVIFADARQEYDMKCIQSLLLYLDEEKCGAVSGQLFPHISKSGIGVGMDLYWKIEKFIRHVESLLYSTIGCTGAVYGMKKKFYVALDSRLILDDLIVPMNVLMNNYFVRYAGSATAYDSLALNPSTEKIRKRRTIAGNFQTMVHFPEYLFKNISVGLMFFSHKISRLISPIFILLLFVYSLMHIYNPCFVFVLFLYAVCVLCYLFERWLPVPFVSKISAYTFMNILVFVGLFDFVKGAYRKGWK